MSLAGVAACSKFSRCRRPNSIFFSFPFPSSFYFISVDRAGTKLVRSTHSDYIGRLFCKPKANLKHPSPKLRHLFRYSFSHDRYVGNQCTRTQLIMNGNAGSFPPFLARLLPGFPTQGMHIFKGCIVTFMSG